MQLILLSFLFSSFFYFLYFSFFTTFTSLDDIDQRRFAQSQLNVFTLLHSEYDVSILSCKMAFLIQKESDALVVGGVVFKLCNATVFISIYLSIYLSIYFSLSIYLSISLSLYIYIYIYIYQLQKCLPLNQATYLFFKSIVFNQLAAHVPINLPSWQLSEVWFLIDNHKRLF